MIMEMRDMVMVGFVVGIFVMIEYEGLGEGVKVGGNVDRVGVSEVEDVELSELIIRVLFLVGKIGEKCVRWRL